MLAGTPYEWIRDYRFLDEVIEFIRDPSLPAGVENRKLMSLLDADDPFAAGLSDGGAQASRMARSWLNTQNESIFKAIVLNAGSWSTCSANFGLPVVCSPVDVTWKHSPTLFLHAEVDSVVGVEHADIYARALEEARDDGNPIEWRALIALDDQAGEPMDRRDYCRLHRPGRSLLRLLRRRRSDRGGPPLPRGSPRSACAVVQPLPGAMSQRRRRGDLGASVIV